jgi:hypothetical protein
MTIREIASELMKNAKPETGFLLKTAIVESDAETELILISRIDTALLAGKNPYLTDETPAFVVADSNESVLSVARLFQKDQLRLETTSGDFKLNGAIKADDLVTFMYGIANPIPTGAFRVTVYRDDGLPFSKSLEKFDLSVPQNFSQIMRRDWPTIIRSKQGRATNNCKKYAFCKNNPTDDKCCNALTGKCHHNC